MSSGSIGGSGWGAGWRASPRRSAKASSWLALSSSVRAPSLSRWSAVTPAACTACATSAAPSELAGHGRCTPLRRTSRRRDRADRRGRRFRARRPDDDLGGCRGPGRHLRLRPRARAREPRPAPVHAAPAPVPGTAAGNHRPFDPHSPTESGGKHGAWWIGDYQGITASAGAFHLLWNDTRTGKLDLFAATVRP